MSDVIEVLKSTLDPKCFLEAADIRARSSGYWDPSPMQARFLVRPSTTREVSETLKICHAHGQSVITHGGLTGCANAAATGPDDVVLSLERMSLIEEIDPLSGVAIVQAGAVLETVQKAIAEQGMLLPLDLGARGSCTIGGNVATNAGGVNVLRYGMVRNLVLGLEVVLANGTILPMMNRMLKNNAGFDLKQMFIGSEGTLGVVTKAVLKLEPLSPYRSTALVALDDFEKVPLLLNQLKKDMGGELSSFELMWGDYFQAVTGEGAHRAPMDRDHAFYVLLEVESTSSDEERFMGVLEGAFEAGLVVDAVVAKSDAEREALWAVRDDFEAILERKPVYLYDVSLPIQDMGTYVERVKAIVRNTLPDGDCLVFGHVGDGNLHLFIMTGADGDASKQVADLAVYEPLKDFGGSVSAEHGIGHEKKKWLHYSRTAEEIALMRSLKASMDPKGILNPGVVFDM